MAITDRTYRTCTYIAGDWDNDNAAVTQLKKWNEGNKWGFTFKDVHMSSRNHVIAVLTAPSRKAFVLA